MTHLSMEALLSLREAGLEPGVAAARQHLESCAGCRAELERLHQRVARLKALPYTPDATARRMLQIYEQIAPQRQPAAQRMLAGAA